MADISIIVSTRNRACTLANALNSIANVVRPSETVEIIVIDNGSSDRTRKVCKHIGERFPRHHWRFFYDDMPGLLTGRHRGAKEAGGDILAYLDDDILLAPTWLESLIEAFSDPSVVLLGGPSTPVFERDPPPWLRDFWTETDKGRLCGWLSLRGTRTRSCSKYCGPTTRDRTVAGEIAGYSVRIRPENRPSVYRWRSFL
jgi:glycosyltransferase involved in cell wall biosynthesis